MSYFPAFIKLENKKVLIVGGGYIASEKISKLLDFTKKLTIVAPNFSNETKGLIDRYDLLFFKRKYEDRDLEGFGIVIVAVDDIELQKKIYTQCQDKGILCNSVDSVDYCDFIFPSYTKKGPLTIAFSTSGISPSIAKYLRRAIEKMIPESIVDFLQEVKELRRTLPKGKERMKLLDEKAKKYLKENNVQ